MTGKYLFSLIMFMFLVLGYPRPGDARIYIDITSPGVRQFPIAVYDIESAGDGKKLTDVIRDDLDFTGLFHLTSPAAFIEDKEDDFNRANWVPLGVEAVVKGSITKTDKLHVEIKFYDVIESSVIFFKHYSADIGMIETLGHTIADDIYAALTGRNGIFRSKISFVADKGDRKDLLIMDYDGRRAQRLGFSKPLMLAPHWDRDHNRIVISVMEDRVWGIYMVDLKKMNTKRIFTAEGINIAGDFSPDGKSFVFSSSINGSPNIYLFDLQSGLTRKVTSSFWIDISPTFSPDGKEIAFVSNKSGNPNVYIMDLNGYNIRRVTYEGTYNTSPSWSPNGDLIAFAGMVNNRNNIFTIKPDGTGLRQLTFDGNNEDPAFSPDGMFIAFTSDRSGKKGVYIMRADGENQKKVSPDGYRAFGPEWY